MISTLTKPTVLVDKSKACKNIAAMADKAKTSGSEFRPHFKTH
jgi:D-serine deaminase-like pyridoxal phosphate-dependent protein